MRTVEMFFWPAKEFHELTKHWNLGPGLLSVHLFSHNMELKETIGLWLLSCPLEWGW